MPEISVIIPVYNCEKYIARGIESVLEQTFQDWELILVNDGSTDRSREICAAYAKRDRRIRLIDKKNGGGGGEARNVGISNACSTFITFLDSDDYYKKEMLERLFSAQREGDYDAVIAGYEEFAEDDELRHPVFYQPAEYRTPKQVRDFFVAHYPEGLLGFPWNKLYRTEIIKKYAITFPKMRRLEDGIFNVAYFARCNSCRVLDFVGHCYRESRQVELGKLPYDFYDIMEVFSEQYYQTMEQWGYRREDSERPIIDYFHNDFVCCLENIVQPVWKYSRNEKIRYIKELREKKLVQYMLQKACMTGRYTGIVLYLFKKRAYFGMWTVIETKRFLKTRCGKIFYRLKDKVN